MIYNAEECEAISDIRQRKELERSVYSSMDALPITVKSLVDSQLELDINRCDSMLRIAENDFTHLGNDLDVLSPHQIIMPIDMYEHYLEKMSEKESHMEGAFMFYCRAGMDFYFHMARSLSLAEVILSGEQVVTYGDFSKLQFLTQLFTDAKTRCVMMGDVEGLPYDSALKYAECMLEECSILKRIHLSKQISVHELCDHVDARERVSPDDFNKLFMPDFPPEVQEGLQSFESKANDRLDLLYAQIIVSTKFGL